MVEKDTVKLLRECDAGIKMGASSIGDVIDDASSSKLRGILYDAKCEHERMARSAERLLAEYEDKGKNINPIARGMSYMKTEAKLMMGGGDKTVASLMTDGCNMGIKSLCTYLNEYKAADERSKALAREVIDVEHRLMMSLRDYL
ncbi:MAG: hypothetical protein J6Q69_07570 [Clostridia bacterium]|nr:hypothetical protein [Clostridia bacterium]